MTEIRVYQAQHFNLTCDCLEMGMCNEQHFDTYAYCTVHGQWWYTDSYDWGRAWRRVKDSKVPYIIRNSDKFRVDEPSHM